jgi:macrolide transport system ATP-binding/permease protein
MLISCRKLTKSFGDKVVLNGLGMDICQGDRIGLVGRNGAGKTTLANILAGGLAYDEGSMISTRQKLSIGYLRQNEAEPELFSSVLSNETMVNGEFQRLTSHLGINRIHDWSGERLRNLSGGEKTKLALAAVLAAQPDLIILDEPTNHMDYLGVEYLVAELNRFSGAAIIISHDRYFLDSTVSQIAEIENGKIKMYPGNFGCYGRWLPGS